VILTEMQDCVTSALLKFFHVMNVGLAGVGCFCGVPWAPTGAGRWVSVSSEVPHNALHSQ
jgi:hypothetical protein